MKLGGIGDQQRLIHGTDARRIDAYFDGAAGQGCEMMQGIGDLRPPAGAEVVNLSGFPMLGKEPITTNDVTDVREIADDVEVADLDGSLAPGLHLGDLKSEGGEYIRGRLPRARVVERPDHDGVGTVRKIMLDAQQVGRGLACGVGIVRP